MTKIGKIRIKGIRGVRAELPLDLEGRSLLLRGDNGSGKSSIAQALRWALTGTTTSSTATRPPPEFERHHLETDPAAAQVVIDLLPNGTIAMKGGVVDDHLTDDAGRAYFDACVRSNPFLRRDELLGLLTVLPGERFKYLERFLDLDRVDELLAALGPLAKEHEAKAQEASERRVRLITSSHACLQTTCATPTSSSEVLATLATEAKRLGFPFDDGTGLAALRAKLGAIKVDSSAPARRVELASALTRARALTIPAHPQSVLAPLREAEGSAEETALAAMLAEALGVVEGHPSRDNCPVCEQSIEGASLAAQLRKRLALLNEVRTLTARATALGRDWEEFLGTLDALGCVARGEPCARAPLPHGRGCLEELERSAGDALSPQILDRLETVRSALASALAAIPDELQASEIVRLASALDAAVAAERALADAETSFESHSRRARELRAIEKAMSEARKDTAVSMLKEIEIRTASFYERIHPREAFDEVTGAPTIKVKRQGSGTAHLRGRFNDVDIDDPRFVYSDGHLDTVGICVFLALRKHSSTGPKLLVLDDIVLSIDLGHSERLVKLLRDEFSDHQILLFSHNELFMKLCKAPFSQAKHLEIVQWTLEHGPRIAGHITNVEELRTKLEESGSAEKVATAMRPVLDAFLHDACSAFEVKVPMTRGRGLTVEEYWSPLRPKLGDLTKTGLLPGLDSVFESVGAPSFFRNALGAHLNPWALETSLGQVQRVAHGILALVEALTCTKCMTIPRLVNARDLQQGFTCDCPRKIGPTLPHQTVPTTGS